MPPCILHQAKALSNLYAAISDGEKKANMKIKFSGLLRTVFLTSLLCMLIPVSFVSVVSVSSLLRNLSGMQQASLAQLSVEKMNEVNQMIDSQIALTKDIANSSFVKDELLSAEDGQKLTEYLGLVFSNAGGLYENIFITKGSEGFADGAGGKTLHSVEGEPWYERCKTGRGFIGNNVSPVTGRPVYVISYGIFDDNGNFLGGLNNSIDLAKMTQGITDSISDGSTQVLIVDIEGNIIASKDDSQILKVNFNDENDSTKLLMQKMASEDSGAVDFIFNGKANRGYFHKSGRMCTVIFMPEEDISRLIFNVVFEILLIIVIAVVVVSVVILLIAYSITKPISVVNSSIQDIASGNADLTKRISINAKHEIKSLVDGFNSFSQKMQKIVGDIKNSENELSEAGGNMSLVSEDTASSITEILANIESMHKQIGNQVSSVSQTSSAVNEIAANIDSLDKMIESQSAGVAQASAAVEQMIGNITSVNQSVEKMAASFESLDKKTADGISKQQSVNEQIQKIEQQSAMLQEANSVISSIAEQTNLLAMNAAIEAAHAGDAGKGFAVVSDEIRKLSETSSAQSKTIGEQLGQITESISSVVSASLDANSAFAEVSAQIKTTDQLVVQIKSAMEEQQEGSKQITEVLHSMNDSTVEVRNSADEMSEGNKMILQEVGNLQEFTSAMNTSMDEMSIGAKKINETGAALGTISAQVKDSIDKIKAQIGQFKV